MHLSLSSPQRLLVDPSLAMAIGLKEAMILHQMHYWLNPDRNSNMKNGRRWVYNTYEQWRRQFPFWSEHTIQRSILNLEKMNILDTYLSGGYRKVKYYSINYDLLKSMGIHSLGHDPKGLSLHSGTLKEENWHTQSSQVDAIDHERMALSYNTENTTEITQHHQSGESDKIAQAMLKEWNMTIHQILHPSKQLFLTPKRQHKLVRTFQSLVSNSFEEWKSFCHSISKSSFLMGNTSNTFRVTFDWALNEQNARKILEGFYDDKDSPPKSRQTVQPWDTYFSALENEHEPTEEGHAWLKISKALAREIGQLAFNCWFKLLKPLKVNEDSIHLLAPNQFIKDYILQEYDSALNTASKQIYSDPPEIQIFLKQPSDLLSQDPKLH